MASRGTSASRCLEYLHFILFRLHVCMKLVSLSYKKLITGCFLYMRHMANLSVWSWCSARRLCYILGCFTSDDPYCLHTVIRIPFVYINLIISFTCLTSMNVNLGVGISEDCFIFDFASLPSQVALPFGLPGVQKWS